MCLLLPSCGINEAERKYVIMVLQMNYNAFKNQHFNLKFLF